jgi:hypothetical protein
MLVWPRKPIVVSHSVLTGFHYFLKNLSDYRSPDDFADLLSPRKTLLSRDLLGSTTCSSSK